MWMFWSRSNLQSYGGAHARYLGNPPPGLEDAVANVGLRLNECRKILKILSVKFKVHKKDA